ncbi:hypothetical protein [Capnocytophaga granulosa]|uniref:hypothetical protein n=1 Tax=Capnocytophaga granulosa TaxID=45242 RepID=UPI0028E4BFFD|nr:hypothetical protein [Capnocytophaga granulosa]
MFLDEEKLWKEYVQGKQTYVQLAEKYSCSAKTIKRKLDNYSVKIQAKTARKVIVLMDTTYWGRTFGVMLFKDAITKENLLKYYVKNETNALYIQGIEELKDKGLKLLLLFVMVEKAYCNLLEIFLYKCVNFIKNKLLSDI